MYFKIYFVFCFFLVLPLFEIVLKTSKEVSVGLTDLREKIWNHQVPILKVQIIFVQMVSFLQTYLITNETIIF